MVNPNTNYDIHQVIFREYERPVDAIADNSQTTYTLAEVETIVNETVVQTRKSLIDDISSSKWMWIGGGAALGLGIALLLK